MEGKQCKIMKFYAGLNLTCLMKITWKRGLMKGSPPGPSLALLAESPVAKSADPKKTISDGCSTMGLDWIGHAVLHC